MGTGLFSVSLSTASFMQQTDTNSPWLRIQVDKKNPNLDAETGVNGNKRRKRRDVDKQSDLAKASSTAADGRQMKGNLKIAKWSDQATSGREDFQLI